MGVPHFEMPCFPLQQHSHVELRERKRERSEGGMEERGGGGEKGETQEGGGREWRSDPILQSWTIFQDTLTMKNTLLNGFISILIN